MKIKLNLSKINEDEKDYELEIEGSNIRGLYNSLESDTRLNTTLTTYRSNLSLVHQTFDAEQMMQIFSDVIKLSMYGEEFESGDSATMSEILTAVEGIMEQPGGYNELHNLLVDGVMQDILSYAF